mgnify:CR=1 FL=1
MDLPIHNPIDLLYEDFNEVFVVVMIKEYEEVYDLEHGIRFVANPHHTHTFSHTIIGTQTPQQGNHGHTQQKEASRSEDLRLFRFAPRQRIRPF